MNGVITERLIYKDQLAPIAKLDADGNILEEYVYALGVNSPDYIRKDGINYRVIKDHLGSVRMIDNASTGEIVKEIEYDEFGNIITETGTYSIPFGFAGGLQDRDTGLIHFGARWYDPEVGRWISKEPLGFEGAMNFYSYCDGDPVNYVDVNGLKTIVLVKYSDWAGHVVVWVENSGKYEYFVDGEKKDSAALYDPMGDYATSLTDIETGKAASISKYIKHFRKTHPENSYRLFEYNTSAKEEEKIIKAMITEGPGVPFSTHYCSVASYNVLLNLDRLNTVRGYFARFFVPFKSVHPYRLDWFLTQLGADSIKTITPEMKYSE